MPVIATNTLENRIQLKQIVEYYAMIILFLFRMQLKDSSRRKINITPKALNKQYLDFQWKNIVRNIWEPFVLDACRKRKIKEELRSQKSGIQYVKLHL